MIEATEALQRLRDGNARFVAGQRQPDADSYVSQRRNLVGGQEPFAVILGCSDSRVPVEIVFDQGLGDLFVVRVAGNIAAPAATESIEFAIDKLGPRLVVVLGHTGCGAVNEALGQLDGGGADAGMIIDSILSVLRALGDADRETLLREGVRANVRRTVAALRNASPVLAPRVQQGGVVVVGAVYELTSGSVEFLDDA